MARPSNISPWVFWRRVMRGTMFVLLGILAMSVALDHAGAFGKSDRAIRRFDRQAMVVTRVIEGDTIVVRASETSSEQTVRLLGIDAPDSPDAHWSERAKRYTAARAMGRTVTLKLDSIGWRTDRGELLAYIFITDGDNLNLDLIHTGQAYADRRMHHSLRSSFEAAEKQARERKRGLWQELTFDQMPAWRREWLDRQRR